MSHLARIFLLIGCAVTTVLTARIDDDDVVEEVPASPFVLPPSWTSDRQAPTYGAFHPATSHLHHALHPRLPDAFWQQDAIHSAGQSTFMPLAHAQAAQLHAAHAVALSNRQFTLSSPIANLIAKANLEHEAAVEDTEHRVKENLADLASKVRAAKAAQATVVAAVRSKAQSAITAAVLQVDNQVKAAERDTRSAIEKHAQDVAAAKIRAGNQKVAAALAADKQAMAFAKKTMLDSAAKAGAEATAVNAAVCAEVARMTEVAKQNADHTRGPCLDYEVHQINEKADVPLNEYRSVINSKIAKFARAADLKEKVIKDEACRKIHDVDAAATGFELENEEIEKKVKQQALQAVACANKKVGEIHAQTVECIKKPKAAAEATIKCSAAKAEETMQIINEEAVQKENEAKDEGLVQASEASVIADKAVLQTKAKSAEDIKAVYAAASSALFASHSAVLKAAKDRKAGRTELKDWRFHSVVKSADEQIMQVKSKTARDIVEMQAGVQDATRRAEHSAEKRGSFKTFEFDQQAAAMVDKYKLEQSAASAQLAEEEKKIAASKRSLQAITAAKEKADAVALQDTQRLEDEKTSKIAADEAMHSAKAVADDQLRQVESQNQAVSVQNENAAAIASSAAKVAKDNLAEAKLAY